MKGLFALPVSDCCGGGNMQLYWNSTKKAKLRKDNKEGPKGFQFELKILDTLAHAMTLPLLVDP